MPFPMWNTSQGGLAPAALGTITVLWDQGWMNGVQMPWASHCSGLQAKGPVGVAATKWAEDDTVVHSLRLACCRRDGSGGVCVCCACVYVWCVCEAWGCGV